MDSCVILAGIVCIMTSSSPATCHVMKFKIGNVTPALHASPSPEQTTTNPLSGADQETETDKSVPSSLIETLQGNTPDRKINSMLEDNKMSQFDWGCSDIPDTRPLPFHFSECQHVKGGSVADAPTCNVTGTFADCSCQAWKEIPKDLDPNITHLLLSHNLISSESLFTDVFKRYDRLIFLGLDHNNIRSLPDAVFNGLSRLEELWLCKNSILYDKTLNATQAFSPLNESLQCLFLNGNTKEEHNESLLMYPDHSLSVLKRLKYLYLDGLKRKNFSGGFQNLTELRNLTLGFKGKNKYCNLVGLSNHTFSYLSQLLYLNLSSCNLTGSLVESATFKPLYRLQTLDVSRNIHLGIDAVGNFMYGLRNNSHFSYLRMQNVVPRFAPCIVIYRYTLRYFPRTGLQVIEAMGNEIQMIEEGALNLLPKTLITVSLANNRITFGAYWRDMGNLTNLKNLHLDGDLNPSPFPNFIPRGTFSCTTNGSFWTREKDWGKESCVCRQDKCASDAQQGKGQLILMLPPQLETFTMHTNSLRYVVPKITFCRNNHLHRVDISSNVFKQLIGPVTGLENLEVLNLSSSFIEVIGAKFLNNFLQLKHLNLYQNLLGDCLANDTQGEVFDNLDRLQYLNLSFNNLYRLNHSNVFQNLSDLEKLDLSINRLSHVEFSIDGMQKLKLLDLHKNNIGSLPPQIRNHIDQLPHKVKVDMRQNPIRCDCDNLSFLEWVVKTKIFGANYTLYYCKYPVEDQDAVEMKNGYDEVADVLRRKCAKNVAMFLGVVSGTLVLVAAIASLLVYRFRWTLRYWYHAAKLKVSSAPQVSLEEFRYDVFVSYATEDTDFVVHDIQAQLKQRGLKVMVHGEEFQVGRHITDNILSAVRDSRKTLVLVTRCMLASYWCTYELQMARMESISTGRDVLMFLFKEEIPKSMMSLDVLSYIKTSTYISYPINQEHRRRFWDKLANDLKA